MPTELPGGRSFPGIVVRATFVSDGEVTGSATGAVMDLAPACSKYAELTVDDLIDNEAEVVLQIDSALRSTTQTSLLNKRRISTESVARKL